MIYRLRLLDGTPVYVYLLLEFQSTPDPWMPLRILVYVGLLYQHLLREKSLSPRGKLPPVFPLVLYNGDAPWDIAPSLRECIELPDHTPLWRYQPQIQHYLVDESRFPEVNLVRLPVFFLSWKIPWNRGASFRALRN